MPDRQVPRALGIPRVRLNMVAWYLVTLLSACRADTRYPSFVQHAPWTMSKLTTEFASKPISTALLGFPSNNPDARAALDWITNNTPRLTSEQRALIKGYEPRCLAQYDHDNVPALLIAGTDGATPAMVAARDVARTA